MSSSKVWLVTGASRGLGFEITKAALAAGHTVIGTYRASKHSPPTITEFEKSGGNWIQLDVGSDNVELQITDAVKNYGRVDVLVNNAAYGIAGTVEDTSMDQVRSLFEVNLFGTMRTIRAIIPSMRAHGGGCIVNIGSANGITALPGIGIYSASKHALEAVTEALQGELAAFNIRVLMVEPGGLATNFTDTREAAVSVPLSSAYKGGIVEQITQGMTNVEGYKARAGSAEKAALRIVEAVDGTGMLTGRNVSLRLPLGSAGPTMCEKGKQFTLLAEGLKDVYESI